MHMREVELGEVKVTRLVTGGNPFSGFSHQSRERDREMLRYYTVARIKEALHKAEAAGINTFFGRTDRHVRRMLLEYWDEGGTIQWFGQTASEYTDQLGAIRQAAAAGAVGMYVHGGIVDYWHAQGMYDMFVAALETMRECGVVAGFAGHTIAAHTWIRDNLEPDFQMCSYYDPSPRGDNPHHQHGVEEKWEDAHRDEMAALIQTIPWPVVHYKVFAGGNHPIRAGFEFLAEQMRPNDLVCIGHYLGDNPDMIAENVQTFDALVEARERVPAD
jgi:hypothetical protein